MEFKSERKKLFCLVLNNYFCRISVSWRFVETMEKPMARRVFDALYEVGACSECLIVCKVRSSRLCWIVNAVRHWVY